MPRYGGGTGLPPNTVVRPKARMIWSTPIGCSTHWASRIRSGTDSMLIKRDDLSGPEVHALLAEHLSNMQQLSPRESVHALDIDGLRHPSITFWTVWSPEGALMGCGALKELDATHGEIKSMRTANARRRNGVGRAMLLHILAEARTRGYTQLSLETGSMAAFEPARALYAAHGFQLCEPFGSYVPDPNSCFMTIVLGTREA